VYSWPKFNPEVVEVQLTDKQTKFLNSIGRKDPDLFFHTPGDLRILIDLQNTPYVHPSKTPSAWDSLAYQYFDSLPEKSRTWFSRYTKNEHFENWAPKMNKKDADHYTESWHALMSHLNLFRIHPHELGLLNVRPMNKYISMEPARFIPDPADPYQPMPYYSVEISRYPMLLQGQDEQDRTTALKQLKAIRELKVYTDCPERPNF
jgi:hypothetical protein